MNKKITNRVSLSLDSYLVEVNKHPLQTVEEQTELAHRIKEGDEEALAQLISGNLRFEFDNFDKYDNYNLNLLLIKRIILRSQKTGVPTCSLDEFDPFPED